MVASKSQWVTLETVGLKAARCVLNYTHELCWTDLARPAAASLAQQADINISSCVPDIHIMVNDRWGIPRKEFWVCGRSAQHNPSTQGYHYFLGAKITDAIICRQTGDRLCPRHQPFSLAATLSCLIAKLNRLVLRPTNNLQSRVRSRRRWRISFWTVLVVL